MARGGRGNGGLAGGAGIGGSKGGMKTAATAKILAARKSAAACAGDVTVLLPDAGDGVGGGWAAKRVMCVVGGSPSSLLLLKNSLAACSTGG